MDLQKISEFGYFLDIFVLSLQSWDRLDWTKKHKTANSYERDNRRSFRPGREGEERKREMSKRYGAARSAQRLMTWTNKGGDAVEVERSRTPRQMQDISSLAENGAEGC